MSKHGWANDDASFVIEKHVVGKVYGTEAVLLQLENMLESLDHKAEGKSDKNKISNFDLIKKQIFSFRKDVSFDKALLATLTKQEKCEADKLLIREILDHNRNCYKYIECLDSVDELDEQFLSTLSGLPRYEVLQGIYLVNRSRQALDEIAAAAYQKIFCFDLLADIYLRTKENHILEIINDIYSEKHGDAAYDFAVAIKFHTAEDK